MGLPYSGQGGALFPQPTQQYQKITYPKLPDDGPARDTYDRLSGLLNTSTRSFEDIYAGLPERREIGDLPESLSRPFIEGYDPMQFAQQQSANAIRGFNDLMRNSLAGNITPLTSYLDRGAAPTPGRNPGGRAPSFANVAGQALARALAQDAYGTSLNRDNQIYANWGPRYAAALNAREGLKLNQDLGYIDAAASMFNNQANFIGPVASALAGFVGPRTTTASTDPWGRSRYTA